MNMETWTGIYSRECPFPGDPMYRRPWNSPK